MLGGELLSGPSAASATDVAISASAVEISSAHRTPKRTIRDPQVDPLTGSPLSSRSPCVPNFIGHPIPVSSELKPQQTLGARHRIEAAPHGLVGQSANQGGVSRPG